MIENCLRHKIIRDFLKHYTEKRWKDLIPSLIEIGILNLQKSFNKILFTNEEIKNVLRNLQISQIEKDKERNKEREKESKEKENFDTRNNSKEKEEKDEKNKICKNQMNIIEIPKSKINGGGGNININNMNNIQRMKMIDIVQNNPEKQEKMKSCTEAIIEMKNNIKNNYHYFKNNISIDFKNKLTKKGEYYKKINIEKNKNNTKKNYDKISYAISYDKDLRPASISKKINNAQNNTNIRNKKTEYTNFNYDYIHNYSSENKRNDNSKSKSKNKKNKKKEKYLNINLNNLNRINNMQNVKRKHYNYYKQNNKNEIIRTGGNEKNNYYKKINAIQNHNLTNNEINNNYQIIKVDRPQINRYKTKNNLNNNISNSYNNNFRNINFLNTLYQRVNSNGEAIKINNDNYFSNRDELNAFIRKNRIILNIKQELNYRNNITKSEKPTDRKNNFLKIDEKEIAKKHVLTNSKVSKKNSKNKINIKNSNIKILNKIKTKENNELIKSYPNSNNIDLMNLNQRSSKTPKKKTINTENDTISISYIKNKINEIEEANNKKDIINNNDEEKKIDEDNIKNGNEGLKTIKLYDLKKAKKSEKNNNFEKVNGKNGECRYFNIFGHEGEEMSLTQMERDYSGLIDSSTSNEIQINPEYLLNETPKNVFKISKSNDQSINSNDNKGQ